MCSLLARCYIQVYKQRSIDKIYYLTASLRCDITIYTMRVGYCHTLTNCLVLLIALCMVNTTPSLFMKEASCATSRLKVVVLSSREMSRAVFFLGTDHVVACISVQ